MAVAVYLRAWDPGIGLGLRLHEPGRPALGLDGDSGEG